MQTTTKMNTILPCDTIHAFALLLTIFITAIFTIKLGMSLQHQTCYGDIIHKVVKKYFVINDILTGKCPRRDVILSDA
jgi:hypothetical protein